MENVNISEKLENYFSELGRWFVALIYVLCMKISMYLSDYLSIPGKYGEASF